MSYFNRTMSYFNKIQLSNGLIQKTTTLARKITGDRPKRRVEMSDFDTVKNSGKLGYGTVVFYWTRWRLTSSYPPPCRILFEFVIFYSILQVFGLLKKCWPAREVIQ